MSHRKSAAIKPASGGKRLSACQRALVAYTNLAESIVIREVPIDKPLPEISDILAAPGYELSHPETLKYLNMRVVLFKQDDGARLYADLKNMRPTVRLENVIAIKAFILRRETGGLDAVGMVIGSDGNVGVQELDVEGTSRIFREFLAKINHVTNSFVFPKTLFLIIENVSAITLAIGLSLYREIGQYQDAVHALWRELLEKYHKVLKGAMRRLKVSQIPLEVVCNFMSRSVINSVVAQNATIISTIPFDYRLEALRRALIDGINLTAYISKEEAANAMEIVTMIKELSVNHLDMAQRLDASEGEKLQLLSALRASKKEGSRAYVYELDPDSFQNPEQIAGNAVAAPGQYAGGVDLTQYIDPTQAAGGANLAQFAGGANLAQFAGGADQAQYIDPTQFTGGADPTQFAGGADQTQFTKGDHNMAAFGSADQAHAAGGDDNMSAEDNAETLFEE
jgi:hypothetical protein